jgi:molybdopterin synthase catalytic subunit
MTAEPFIDIVDGPIVRKPYGRPILPDCGAVVEFSGIVRDTEDEHPILGIEYEAFREMALAELHRIAEEMVERYELTDLVCVHRVGLVPVHEAAVYVRTAARHRQGAFEANIEFIERLKRRVPIWKHPVAWAKDQDEG